MRRSGTMTPGRGVIMRSVNTNPTAKLRAEENAWIAASRGKPASSIKPSIWS